MFGLFDVIFQSTATSILLVYLANEFMCWIRANYGQVSCVIYYMCTAAMYSLWLFLLFVLNVS